MKILITGSNGQLGQQLCLNALKEINGKKIKLIFASRDILDLENLKECSKFIKKICPDWVINAAAYTNVEKAEEEFAKAILINSQAPKIMAEEVHKIGGKFLQLSTDYVFDGEQNVAYKTNQKRNPLNSYGKSKCLGEENIEEIFKNSSNGIILRSSWILGNTGKNFLKSILKLIKQGNDLKIISDQIAAPTNSYKLSKICWQIINKFESGVKIPKTLHWCDAGVSSWYDIAHSIYELSNKYGILKKSVSILPISSSQYSSKADRPKFSLLDCSLTSEILNEKQIYWKDGIENSLKKLL